MTFTSSLGALTRADVFDDVRDELVVEARPACGFAVESGVSIEIIARDDNGLSFDELEGGAQMIFEFKSVVIIVRDDPGGCQNEAFSVGDGENIGRFSFLPSLIDRPPQPYSAILHS